MNNKSKLLSLRGMMLTLALAAPTIAQANAVNVVYINGIQNTLTDAQKANNKIDFRLNNWSPNHSGTAKKSFSVTAVWNPVGWYGNRRACLSCLTFKEDQMEIFLLKTAEEKYKEDFKNISVPHNQSGVIDQLAAKRIKEAYLDNMLPGDNSIECVPGFFITCTGISSTVFGISANDMKSTQKAATDLAARVKNLGSAIVIAHSQGNMLANLAYASIASEFGNDAKKMIRVINVANNSEFSVNSLDFTHAGDYALKMLEVLPSVGGNWYRTTLQCPDPYPSWKACDFVRSIPNFGEGVGGSFPYHDMVDIYLSTNTVPILDAQGVSFTPGAEQFIDRFEDFVYAAACSLSATCGRLNDTGITASQCYMAGSDALVACNSAEAIALNNAQDGMIGRDADEALNNPADGKLGFSFAAVAGGCVQDNVTGLMWEIKTTDGGLRDWNKRYRNNGDNRAGDASAYTAAVNATNLCGHNDWRLPTADELQSIVDYGVAYPGPTIDATWFPNSMSSVFWSASPSVAFSNSAWYVGLDCGGVSSNLRDNPIYVRLVRAGQ